MAAREFRVYHIPNASQEQDDALHAVRLDGIAAFFRATGFGYQVGRDEWPQMMVYLSNGTRIPPPLARRCAAISKWPAAG